MRRRAELEGLARGLMQRATRSVLRTERVPACEVSILVTGDEEIRELNRTWREVDAPTDVLSFPQWEDGQLPTGEEAPPLGDLVISAETALRQARDLGVSLDSVVGHLVVHGVLHLLGHDHDNPSRQRDMRRREEEALAALGLGPVLWDEHDLPSRAT